jgi:hypothetical protein
MSIAHELRKILPVHFLLFNRIDVEIHTSLPNQIRQP